MTHIQKRELLDSIDAPLKITMPSQSVFTCSKSAVVTLEQDAISAQS